MDWPASCLQEQTWNPANMGEREKQANRVARTTPAATYSRS